MREVGGQLWEQKASVRTKGIELEAQLRFLLPFPFPRSTAPFSFIMTLLSLISSFPSYIRFLLRFQKSQLWHLALPPAGQLILDKSLHLSSLSFLFLKIKSIEIVIIVIISIHPQIAQDCIDLVSSSFFQFPEHLMFFLGFVSFSMIRTKSSFSSYFPLFSLFLW